MSNPTYEMTMSGAHIEKTPMNENGVEYDFDNPLYMMGVQPLPANNEDVPAINEPEYATTDDIVPSSTTFSAQPPNKDYYDDIVRPTMVREDVPAINEPEYATTDDVIPSKTISVQSPNKDYYDDIVRPTMVREDAPAINEPEYATTDDVIPSKTISVQSPNKDYYDDIVRPTMVREDVPAINEPEYATTDDVIPSKTISVQSPIEDDVTTTRHDNNNVGNYDDVITPKTTNAVTEVTYAEPDIGESISSPHPSPSARPPSPVYAEPQVNTSSQQTVNNPPISGGTPTNHYYMADDPPPTADTLHRPSIYESDTDSV